MLQYSLRDEATCEVGMEKGMDEVSGCDVEHENQINAFPETAIGPRCTFVRNILLLPLWKWTLASVSLPYHLLHAICPEGRASADGR